MSCACGPELMRVNHDSIFPGIPGPYSYVWVYLMGAIQKLWKALVSVQCGTATLGRALMRFLLLRGPWCALGSLKGSGGPLAPNKKATTPASSPVSG